MEEYMTFVETFSPYILHGLPWRPEHQHIQEVFERQWGLLRRIVLFCLRHHEGQHTPARLDQVQAHLDSYGASITEVCMCTYHRVMRCTCFASSG